MPIGGLSTKLSPLLAKIFVCVSFAWDVGKLGYLEQTVKTVLGYPTSVDVCVVTTSPQKLERVFGTWDVSGERLWVCTESWATDLDDHDYALLWRHRSVLAAAAAGNTWYTTYMYMEDDTQVPWRAMTSWARNTPALALHNLIYGFYRTEVSPKTGELVMMDFGFKANLSASNTLHINGFGDFVELHEPYFGMWLASNAQLREFMAHPFWDKETALAYEHLHGGGYMEKTNWMFQYVNVPAGYRSRSVVQYNPKTHMLEPRARIVHLRNGYSVQEGLIQGKIPLAQALSE